MNVPVTAILPGVAPGLPPAAQSLAQGVAPSAFLDTLTGALARVPETRSTALDRLVAQLDREAPRTELAGLAEGLAHPALPQLVASLVGAEGRAARLAEALPSPSPVPGGAPAPQANPGGVSAGANAAPALPVDVARALAASDAAAAPDGRPVDPAGAAPADRALRGAPAAPTPVPGASPEASLQSAASPRAEAVTAEAPREVAAEALRNLARSARGEGTETRLANERVEPAPAQPAGREAGPATEGRPESAPDADGRARDDSGSRFREDTGSRFRDDPGARFRNDPAAAFRNDPGAAFRDDPGARLRLEGTARIGSEGAARLPDPAALTPRDALGRPVPAEIAGGVPASPSADGVQNSAATAPGREAVPVSRATEAMAAHVQRLANAEGGTARIRLHPQSLGELHLQVRVRGQAVQVTVVAHEAAAKAVVEGGREQLADALSTRELRMESFEVHGASRDDTRDARSETGRGLRDPAQDEGRPAGQHAREERDAPDAGRMTTPATFAGLAAPSAPLADGRGHWVT